MDRGRLLAGDSRWTDRRGVQLGKSNFVQGDEISAGVEEIGERLWCLMFMKITFSGM